MRRVIVGFEFPDEMEAAKKLLDASFAPTSRRRRSMVYDDGERGIGTALQAIEVLVRQGFTFRVEVAGSRSQEGSSR
jgi:hypothetical protein